MSWLDSILRRLRGPSGTAAAPRSIRGSYDAARESDDDRRHWYYADYASANAVESPAARAVIRNRARYEVANNSIARGISNTLALHTIGTGPRLQIQIDDDQTARRVEHEFARWAAAVDLAGKLRVARKCRLEAGECFLVLALNERNRHEVKLDVRLLEPDQVATPDYRYDSRGELVDGIEYDAWGNPSRYHILKTHPGAAAAMLATQYDSYPASAVCHYFVADRPGQSRGVPEIMPALRLFAQLRRYSLAVLMAAETAANMAGVLKTEAGPSTYTGSQLTPDTIEIERGQLTTLPAGYDLSQLKAEQPTTTYPQYVRSLIMQIARVLSMPYNIAAGDSAGFNYASGRLDHQVYFRTLAIERDVIQQQVLDRLLDAWLSEASLITGLLPAKIAGGIPHSWMWDGDEHVDPVKEAMATQIELQNGTTTYADVYARKGKDYAAAFRQIAFERKQLSALGITIMTPSGAELPTGDHDEEDADAKASATAA